MWYMLACAAAAFVGFFAGYIVGRAEKRTRETVARILRGQLAEVSRRDLSSKIRPPPPLPAASEAEPDGECPHGLAARNRDGDCVACASDERVAPCSKCGVPVHVPGAMPPPGIRLVCHECIGSQP